MDEPVGVDRRVRRLVESKVPNLGRLNDIADYIVRSGEGAAGGMMGAGGISDSEAEDEAHQVDMPPSGLTRRRKKKNGDGSSTGTGGGGGSKSASKLVELGPRLRLKLYKVERLLSEGGVMYHAYVSKTPAEVAALKKRKDGEASLKKRRREEQEGGSSTGTGGGGGSKSALKLVELGPRLRLKLYKVERLLSGGDVMYHAYVSKTPAEVAALKKRKDGEASLKKRRREEQEGNVERKKRVNDEKQDAREGRRKEREYRTVAALRGEGGGSVGDDDDGSDDGNSDDGDGEEEDGGSKSGDGDDDDDDDDDASGSEDEGESEGSSRE